MRKRFISLVLITLISSSLFANFFAPRFFEFTTNIPFSVTNNAFMLDDILQEHAVIDLGKMADDLPKSGFQIITTANPYTGFNLNLEKFHLGALTGVDVFTKFSLSKALFDFIGNGNELYEDLEVAAVITGDVFYHADLETSFLLGKSKVTFRPCVFIPLAHITTEDSHITFSNKEDGTIGVDMLTKAALYSIFDFNDIEFSPLTLTQAMGFDWGTSISFPYSSMLILSGSLRIPIYPGHLNYVSYYSFAMQYETKLSELANGDFSSLIPEMDSGLSEETYYSIHRPFKLNAQVDFMPLGDFLVFTSQLGLGVRNPLANSHDETRVYPEYYFGATIKSGGLAKATVSTEYTDELFKHQISGMINLRVFQMELGFATASASMASSFRGAGFAAYVTTSWGF